MKWVAVGLAVLAAATGLTASWYWYLSSTVALGPFWEPKIEAGAVSNIASWVAGIMKSAREASRLNRLAALWTAASVGLGAASAFVSAVAN